MNHPPLTVLAATALALCFAARGHAQSRSASSGPAPSPNQSVAAVAVDADESAFFEPDPFVPDVHASREDAARALGTKWATAAASRWKHPPERVRMMSADPSLYAPLREGILSKLRGVPVQTCDGTLCQSESAPPTEAWVYLDVSGSPADSKPTRGRRDKLTGASGTLSARAVGATDSAATVKFVEKPWVSDFAAFTAHSPARWAVARSDPDRPASSARDAWMSARSAAAHEVLPLVEARLHGRRYDRGAALRTIENRLLGDRMIADRFAQKFERPYGTLYRETVLVDASDATLDAMAGEIGMTLDAQRHTRRNGFAAAGAILLVTYALYRLANAFTRGYFTWSLRTAAAVVAAGAVTAIVALA